MEVDNGLRALEHHIRGTAEGHYAGGEKETIDVIMDINPIAFGWYAIGNIIKYVSRFPVTRNKDDLLKAAHYLLMVWEKSEDPVVLEDTPEDVTISMD